MPVIPATRKAEAGELLEPGRRRLQVLLCCPGWSTVVRSLLTAVLNFWAEAILLTPAPETIGVHQHAQLKFLFPVEMRPHFVAQASLELLGSNSPPASALQIRASLWAECDSRVTGMIAKMLNN
ncbi:LOW QUALITY PROTEIN: EEF1A lysine methyltransferase 2 [Plecturocebus cupreus]